MTREDFYVSLVVGFLVGLFGFAAILVRVRRWPFFRQVRENEDRYRPGQPTGGPSPRGTLHNIVMMDYLADFAGTILVLALLAYGAVVSPRLRYVLLVAVITAAISWRVWLAVMKWMKR